MERVLKKYTTIPQHLYVERNADIQLKRIIEDMQRPGYVLVARQMGKTNLLFNAKRTLENSKRLLAYIDLSNPFDNERDCYRNIINNIIEPNIDIFNQIYNEIDSIRSKELPPHSEYSRSLIQILNFIEGELVIILDEIDALKSVKYSDNIFAQIRSNYFSRTNFPVFEKLTYVLSGVIEPTELIKDKNKSPFNIGEKIYLDDFSKEEHQKFIEKSQLKISDEISDFIYEWTNGNPRITFDLCSEIENFIIENGNVDKIVINQIIREKYLTAYDIAPIDHIRELVKSNQEVRDSIIQILKNENDVSDSVKSKLYLYGITSSNFNSEIKIKNKIIEEALNIEWIKSIDKSSKRLLNYGLDNIESKNYGNAVKYLNEFIQNHEVSETDSEIAYYNLGVAYFYLENYEDAIEFFTKKYNIALLRKNALSFKGMSLLSLGKIEEGRAILEKVCAKKENDFAYRNAILNLASLLIDDNPSESLSLFEELYQSTFDSKDNAKENDLIHIRVLCLYNIADINLKKNDKKSAIICIDKALEGCSPQDSPFLIFYKFKLVDDEFALKNTLVRAIVDNKLSYNDDDDEKNPLKFNYLSLIHYLEILFDQNDNQLFEELLTYAKHNLVSDPNQIYKLIYSVSVISKKSSEILNYLLNLGGDIDDYLFANIFVDKSYDNIDEPSLFLENFTKFLIYLDAYKLSVREIYLFAVAIKFYHDNKEYYKSLRLANLIISKFKKHSNNIAEYELIIIYYWRILIYYILGDKTNTMVYAGYALKILSETPVEISMIDEEGLKSIKDQINKILQSSFSNL